MSYLGQIPQTTRSGAQFTVGTGTNQTLQYDLTFYQIGFIDVYVNGHRLGPSTYPNDPDAATYHFADGTIASGGVFDGRYITIFGLNHNDVVEIVNYATMYLAGPTGGGGTIDQGTFDTMFNTLLLTPSGFQIDGGAF